MTEGPHDLVLGKHLDGLCLWRTADGALGHDRPLTPEEHAHLTKTILPCLTATAVLCLSTVAVPLGGAADHLGLIPVTSDMVIQ